MSPQRTTGAAPAQAAQPPRPPNAWILYRSDKTRTLPPTAPGDPRRAQADVSKIISDMWKSEKPEVRAEYERRADLKKAEHLAKYPSYKFNPMKKEEKQRIREEQKLQKERERAMRPRRRGGPREPATYVPAVSYPAVAYYPVAYHPHPGPGPHPQDAIYGYAGPSPPMSQADSPASDGSPYLAHSPAPGPSQTPQPPQSNHASSSKESSPTASAQPNLPAPHQMKYYPNVVYNSQPVRSTSAQSSRAGGSNSASPTAQAPTPESKGSSPKSQSPQRAEVASEEANDPNAMLQYHIPNFGDTSWDMDGSADALRALASGDANVFNVPGVNPDDLFNMQGELKVTMGNQEMDDIFKSFDFSSVLGTNNQAMASQSSMASSLPTPMMTPEDMFFDHAMDHDFQQDSPVIEQDYSAFMAGDAMFQYMDFDQNIDPQLKQSQTRPPPLSHSQSSPAVTSSKASYVPPSGAAKSATRRVAASWKPTFASEPESPIDNDASSQMWGVSATS